MSIKFTMKENKERRIFGAYAIGELEIKGLFHMQGPQPVDNNGGAPLWVADFFDKYPNINQIALSGKNHSVVYGRIKESKSEIED